MKKRLDQGIDCILAMILAAMTVIVFTQVFFRYVLNSPLAWPEEVARLMIVWLTFLGGYMALREKKHIGFNLLVKKLAPKTQQIVTIAGKVLIILFLLVTIKEGVLFAKKFANVPMPYTQFPIGKVAYTVFPISGVLMLLQMVEDLSQALSALKHKNSSD
ncbi:MAG: TRAP transporter small permease [bacterium]|nr:TRAP transporter small permease [bacterium]